MQVLVRSKVLVFLRRFQEKSANYVTVSIPLGIPDSFSDR